MRTRTKVALMVGAALVTANWGQSAHAAFVITLGVPVVSGFDDVYEVQALNTGNGTGTKLAGFDSTITTPGTTTATALVVDMVDTDGDGVPDANILGSGLSFGSSAGTFERIGNVDNGSFSPASVSPTPYDTDPGSTGSQTQSVNPAYSDLHSLEIAGIYTLNNGVADSTTPQNFANIVVPIGTTFTVSGEIGGDMGSEQAFSIGSAAVPEPASLGLICLGSLGVLRRRRSR